jgi:hypothetical protein
MTLPYELRWAFDPAGDCACESIVDLGNGLFCDPHIAPTLPLANSEETWHRHFDGGNGRQPADRTMPCRHQAEFFLDIAETFIGLRNLMLCFISERSTPCRIHCSRYVILPALSHYIANQVTGVTMAIHGQASPKSRP